MKTKNPRFPKRFQQEQQTIENVCVSEKGWSASPWKHLRFNIKKVPKFLKRLIVVEICFPGFPVRFALVKNKSGSSYLQNTIEHKLKKLQELYGPGLQIGKWK